MNIELLKCSYTVDYRFESYFAHYITPSQGDNTDSESVDLGSNPSGVE